MSRKAVVTGASGYVGGHLVTALLDAGWDVYAVDLNLKGIDSRAKPLDVSIFDAGADVYEKLGRPELCVHLAWRNGFLHKDPSHMEDLSRHFAFLRALIDAGIPRLAVMGTMHEVGYWEGAVDENTPCAPLSLYGTAKNALRQAALLYAQGKATKLYWLRGFYFMGDDARNSSIFSRILQWEAEGKATFPFTSGKNQYDFMHIRDFAANAAAVLSQTEVTGVINVCTGVPVPLADEVERFLHEHGLRIRPEYGAFPDRPYDSPAIWGDRTKLDAALRAAGCENAGAAPENTADVPGGDRPGAAAKDPAAEGFAQTGKER